MKKTKNILAICMFCIMAFGCKDSFLELAPKSNANSDLVFRTQKDFELSMNAAYATLYTFYGPIGAVSYCGEQMGDNCTMSNTVTGSVTDKRAFREYTLQPVNSQLKVFWNQVYNAMFDINVVLEKVEGADLTDIYKESVRSQMRFLRALYYYNMVQMWGDVPLITKPITSYSESYSIKRSPAADVYAQIVADLQFAIDRLPLPANVSAAGKPTKYAAQMLLGKVYLLLGNKTSAATVLGEVYGKYQLVTPYNNLWGSSNTVKNSVESIFEIQYKGGTGNPYSTYYPAFAPYENFTITSYSEGMNLVTNDLYNEFETGDIRRAQTINNYYLKANGDTVKVKYQNKWIDKTVTYGSEYCNNNFMVLRYADLLLLLSEATGDAKYLNEVRARVSLPLFGDVAYPAAYSTLDLAIEHERRVELALEFHRWFDLKRLGRAAAVLGPKKGGVTIYPLLPIPQNVIDENPSVMTQNAPWAK